MGCTKNPGLSRLSSLLAWLAATFYSLSADAAITVLPGPPPGFENLAAPRATEVTVDYGGEPLGSFAAHYAPATLSFDAPEAVVAAIPSVKDKQTVVKALTGPLPAHAELLCLKNPSADCGKLSPEVAGVIFDQNRLHAEIFISRTFLAVQDYSERYLPLPERRLSSIYDFSGAVSGTDENDPAFTLTNNSTLSFGEGNLQTQTTLSNQGLRFETASLSAERDGVRASGGLMRSRAMQLLGDSDIAGVSVSTSMRTRLDARKVEGNDILVYLPRRSFVSVYREGKLYSSRSYEAGNQRIDTTELPDGAYTITLKIQDTDGTTREETRFFAKSEQIPPPDVPVYYLEGGVIRAPFAQDSTLPVLMTNAPVVNAGTVRRITDNAGLSLGVTGLSDRALMETSAFMIASSLQARVTALGSSRGDMGAQTGVQYISPGWNLTTDMRRIWSDDALPEAYTGMLSPLTQATVGVNYLTTPSVTLSAHGSYAKAEGQDAVLSFGPSVNWRLWQQGESVIDFSADAARVENENQGTIFLRFSYKMGEYGVSGEGGVGIAGAAPGPYGTARLWQDHEKDGEGLIAGVGVHEDSRNSDANADADWHGALGRFQGSIQQSFGGKSQLNYGGNFTVGAAATPETLHIGGLDPNNSAVAVEVDGDADADMTIYIDSSPRGTVHVGNRQIIYLSPYNTYKVHLTPSKAESMLAIEGVERKVTLYPGNVAQLHWRVDRLTVVAGRIVASTGQPLADAVMEGNSTVSTDAKGFFQAELRQSQKVIFTTGAGARCAVIFPEEVPAVNGVKLYHKPLMCKIIS